LSLLAAMAGTIGGPRASLSFLTDITDFQAGVDSEASLSVESDGDVVSLTTSGGTIDVGDWIIPKAAAGANYEVRVTVNSGSLTSGTTGSWLSLGSTRSWTAYVLSGGGTVSANITVEIRRAGVGSALASATLTISATSI